MVCSDAVLFYFYFILFFCWFAVIFFPLFICTQVMMVFFCRSFYFSSNMFGSRVEMGNMTNIMALSDSFITCSICCIVLSLCIGKTLSMSICIIIHFFFVFFLNKILGNRLWNKKQYYIHKREVYFSSNQKSAQGLKMFIM